MFDKIKTFYGISKPVPPLQCGPKERDRLYRRLRFQSFLARGLASELERTVISWTQSSPKSKR